MRSIGVRSIVRGDNVSNGQNDLYDGYLKAAFLHIAFHIVRAFVSSDPCSRAMIYNL